MFYALNKANSRTVNNKPTLTDQSAAKETDRTNIVNRIKVHGQYLGSSKEPIYGDFTRIPHNLRDLLNLVRNKGKLRASLPPELRERSLDELLALTPAQLEKILTPPPKPDGEKKEDKPNA